MVRIVFFGFFLFLFLGISLNPLINAEELEEFHSVYAGLLERHTRPNEEREGITLTLVDYLGWSNDPAHSESMEKIAVIDPSKLQTDEHIMAFWINAYNLLTVDLIVKTKEKRSIKRQGGIIRGVWRKHFWTLFDRDYSLHQIEHEILRPMGDARIHFAINCASLSCPDLRTEPYIGELLDSQLDDQTKAFMLNPTKGVAIYEGVSAETDKRGNRKNDAEGQIAISELFFWYEEDFGGKQGVRSFIHKYIGYEPNNRKMRSLDYDWSLNGDW